MKKVISRRRLISRTLTQTLDTAPFSKIQLQCRICQNEKTWLLCIQYFWKNSCCKKGENEPTFLRICLRNHRDRTARHTDCYRLGSLKSRMTSSHSNSRNCFRRTLDLQESTRIRQQGCRKRTLVDDICAKTSLTSQTRKIRAGLGFVCSEAQKCFSGTRAPWETWRRMNYQMQRQWSRNLWRWKWRSCRTRCPMSSSFQYMLLHGSSNSMHCSSSLAPLLSLKMLTISINNFKIPTNTHWIRSRTAVNWRTRPEIKITCSKKILRYEEKKVIPVAL